MMGNQDPRVGRRRGAEGDERLGVDDGWIKSYIEAGKEVGESL